MIIKTRKYFLLDADESTLKGISPQKCDIANESKYT